MDTLVAIAIATVTFATMLPMSIYSGKVLLQVSHIASLHFFFKNKFLI